MQKISVVIVTYNSQRTIKECLESLLKHSEHLEVIVVDNKSIDQTVSIVKNYGNKVTFIEADDNLGFSKANNLGVQSASGHYLIFLNPDTRILRKGDLEKLVQVMEENVHYGVIGPKLVYPDGKIQARSRNLPTISRAFQEYILGKKGVYDFYQPKGENLIEVESIIGACMVIEKDLFNLIGGFNEKYFMYYEDLELCKKVRECGLKIGYYPEVTIEHAEGVSGVNQKTYKLLQDSAKKYHGLPEYYLIQFILRLGGLINAVIS